MNKKREERIIRTKTINVLKKNKNNNNNNNNNYCRGVDMMSRKGFKIASEKKKYAGD